MHRLTVRDEREEAVDRAADRLGYLVLAFGLLAIVAVRSFVGGEASWDLLGLVVVSGIVGAAYRWSRGVLTRDALLLLGAAVVAAALVAVVIVVTGVVR
jgi:hypothetical protein